MSYDCWGFGGAGFFNDLDVGACIFLEHVPIETLNISFESTPNKQQCDTKITCNRCKEKNYGDKKCDLKNCDFLDSAPLPHQSLIMETRLCLCRP